MAKTARQGFNKAVTSRAGRHIAKATTTTTERIARIPRGTAMPKPAPVASVEVKGITPEMIASAARIQVTADKKSGRPTAEWIVELAKKG